jgi:aryl-alcohol dehydrogenase-like predicted oxidoreductase
VIYQGACDYQRAPFGIIPYARAQGLGIVAMRTLTSGVFQKFMKQAFPSISGEAVSQAALGFALACSEVDVALAGMRTPAEVRRNIKLADSSPLYDPKAFHAFYEN